MTDDERLQWIKARCDMTSYLIVPPNGAILDPDIPYLLERLEASQRRAAELEYVLEQCAPNHPLVLEGVKHV